MAINLQWKITIPVIIYSRLAMCILIASFYNLILVYCNKCFKLYLLTMFIDCKIGLMTIRKSNTRYILKL